MKTANEIGKGFNLAHDFWKITVHQSKEDPQQEPLEAMAAGAGTEMLVTSGPQVGSRRQVRPAYTLPSPTL